MDDVVTLQPGYITIPQASGPAIQFPLADILRAADIPMLTYSQVAAITTLANLTVILIRTLIERGVLDEDFSDSLGLSMDLAHIIQVVENMGGTYHEPDFNDVENP
uniref:Uncharacterized protein n=1 Tax=viral metagenome TaxID=1070528 RepID=A0A6M3KL61_9ZZZZ